MHAEYKRYSTTQFIADKKNQLLGFSYPHWFTMHGQPHIRFTQLMFLIVKYVKTMLKTT